jgi:hypothetical protein
MAGRNVDVGARAVAPQYETRGGEPVAAFLILPSHMIRGVKKLQSPYFVGDSACFKNPVFAQF